MVIEDTDQSRIVISLFKISQGLSEGRVSQPVSIM